MKIGAIFTRLQRKLEFQNIGGLSKKSNVKKNVNTCWLYVICQLSKSQTTWTVDEAHKKELNISKSKYNEVNFEAIFGCPQNYSKTFLYSDHPVFSRLCTMFPGFLLHFSKFHYFKPFGLIGSFEIQLHFRNVRKFVIVYKHATNYMDTEVRR